MLNYCFVQSSTKLIKMRTIVIKYECFTASIYNLHGILIISLSTSNLGEQAWKSCKEYYSIRNCLSVLIFLPDAPVIGAGCNCGCGASGV